MLENLIVIALLSILIGGIVTYLIRAKRQGTACIGCPYAKQCNEKIILNCSQKTPDTYNKKDL